MVRDFSKKGALPCAPVPEVWFWARRGLALRNWPASTRTALGLRFATERVPRCTATNTEPSLGRDTSALRGRRRSVQANWSKSRGPPPSTSTAGFEGLGSLTPKQPPRTCLTCCAWAEFNSLRDWPEHFRLANGGPQGLIWAARPGQAALNRENVSRALND
jgi:hypothetical protein